MAESVSSVSVAPMSDGCVIRVTGRGTVRESRVIKDVAARTLKGDAGAKVVLDIGQCGYVDSTFLGTLMDLHRTGEGKRFTIAAPAETRKKLLGIARLDKLIPGVDASPAPAGKFVALPATDATTKEILQHVMECHQELARIDCPMSPIFSRIATQMQKELDEQK